MSKLTATGKNISQATSLFKGDVVSGGGRLPKATITVVGAVTAVALNDFQPTFNGAQHPTVVASALADYFSFELDGPANSDGDAGIWVGGQNSTGQFIITVVGSQSGGDFDQGSGATPNTDIFELNEEPDEIKIVLTSPVQGSLGATDASLGQSKVGLYTDSSWFDPTSGIPYGYNFTAHAEANDPGHPPPRENWAEQLPLLTYHFRKAGFNDLSVTYKLDIDVLVEAEGDVL